MGRMNIRSMQRGVSRLSPTELRVCAGPERPSVAWGPVMEFVPHPDRTASLRVRTEQGESA
jgi:hypothetical protein